MKRIKHLLITLATALVLAGCGAVTATPPAAGAPAAAPAAEAATQTNEGEQVTVTATWTGQAAGPVFTVVLDTHSVDLDAIDLGQLATLRVDGVSVQATGWDAPKGGHHREGTLTFPTMATGGQPIIGPQTTGVELTIRDVAGVPERIFRWTTTS